MQSCNSGTIVGHGELRTILECIVVVEQRAIDSCMARGGIPELPIERKAVHSRSKPGYCVGLSKTRRHEGMVKSAAGRNDDQKLRKH